MKAECRRVVVTLEQCFDRTPDGAVWSSGPFTSTFWSRYLKAFTQICVMARVRDVEERPATGHVVSGPSVRFLALPPYAGAAQFVRHAARIRRAIAAELRGDDAVILRVPSPIASCVVSVLRRRQQPYAVEVVGDALDVLSRGSYRHPLRPVLQWALTRAQRRHCASAAAAAYVTREALQARYPCREYSVGISDVQLPEAALRGLRPFTTYYSSVELNREAFATPRAPDASHRRRFQVITVGTLAQLYKAPDVLINAFAKCRSTGLDAHLTIVGDGQYRPMLEKRCDELGIAQRVTFTGYAAGPEAVRGYLDASDLFVLPSRQEGLPRAMIEAMARGLPCIGSRVGGIPELLEDEDLTEAGSIDSLASKILEMASSPERLRRAANRNFLVAKQYSDDLLGAKRNEFYERVKQLTAYAAAMRSQGHEEVA